MTEIVNLDRDQVLQHIADKLPEKNILGRVIPTFRTPYRKKIGSEISTIKNTELRLLMRDAILTDEDNFVIRTESGPGIFSSDVYRLCDLGLRQALADYTHIKHLANDPKTDMTLYNRWSQVQRSFSYLKDKPDVLNLFNLGMLKIWYDFDGTITDPNKRNEQFIFNKQGLIEISSRLVNKVANDISDATSNALQTMSEKDKIMIAQAVVFRPFHLSTDPNDHNIYFREMYEPNGMRKQFLDSLSTREEYLKSLNT